VLHLSIEHLNQYASDGVTVSWPTVISHVQENDLNLDPPTTPETAVLLPKTDRMSATMLAMPFLTTKTAVWSSRRMYSYVHVASYGEGDRDVLLFPTDKGSYEEYEQGGLFSLISDVLRERIRLYSFRAQYAWLENVNYAGAKALDEWDDVLMKEILPLIRRERGTNAMPLTCGVGDAAFLAANALFRHPDSFAGLIGVNGLYGAQAVTRRSRAELYFHDPVAFLSKLTGHEHHLLLQDGKHIALLAGQGVPAAVDSTHDLTNVLRALNVRVTTDLWGADVDDSWPWRAKLLAHALSAL
jgi:esterase/lipase superfamily enzyme